MVMFRRKSSAVEDDAAHPGKRWEAAERSIAPSGGANDLDGARALLQPILAQRLDEATLRNMSRNDIAKTVREVVTEVEARGNLSLNRLAMRDLTQQLTNQLAASVAPSRQAAAPRQAPGPFAEPFAAPPQPTQSYAPAAAPPQTGYLDAAESERPPDSGPLSAAIQSAALAGEPAPAASPLKEKSSSLGIDALLAQPAVQQPTHGPGQTRSSVEEAKPKVQPFLMDRIDVAAASQLPRNELARQIGEIVVEITTEQKMRLNLVEQRELVTVLINDMLGLGPLEPLLDDDTVTDIMVNGPNQVYVERRGKLELTPVRFQDNNHVMNIAQRIVTQVGRRIDESQPLVDARLQDGSRVNIIAPPLAIDGCSISIRKFSKKSITLDMMAKQQNISQPMSTVLKIAARCELNTLISGGTGSGKTTLLNAMSQMIDHGERIVTIEDAAELQLQQPHVVRLETRPANLEGHGEINMRDLVKNALRMRPDRIILGEVRSGEALDMLQAMNTGHEGSMCTVHANRPREALTRLENMVGMAGVNLPAKAVRQQIASAVNLIVQISRMRDGMRRITSITEVMGMEGDVIITQELFKYDFEGEEAGGKLRGTFHSAGLRPFFTAKAEYYGLDRALLEVI